MKKIEDLKYKYKDIYEKNPKGRAKYIWRFNEDYKRWYAFLKQFKTQKILDFGSGSGIALKAGIDIGLNIIGLDIETSNVYKDMNEILEVFPIIYDGVTIPSFNTKFDIIIFNWSFVFDFSKWGSKIQIMNNESLLRRITQLENITENDGCWYISPKEHYEIGAKLEKKIEIKYFIL